MPSSESETSERVVRLLGVGSAVGQAVAFSFVGILALDSPAYGLIVGAMSGLGAYLFVPWFVQLSTLQENGAGDPSIVDAVEQTPGRPQRHLFGLGLELGAIVMLMIGFTLDAPVLVSGTAGGLTVALFVYLVASIGLSRLPTTGD